VLYVSLSGDVVQEAFVAALDARGVPLTHHPTAAPWPSDGRAGLPRAGRRLRDPRPAHKDLRRPGRTDSVLAAVDTALAHGHPDDVRAAHTPVA
jgi:hypothetical protein